jgi:hypothetical protein
MCESGEREDSQNINAEEAGWLRHLPGCASCFAGRDCPCYPCTGVRGMPRPSRRFCPSPF